MYAALAFIFSVSLVSFVIWPKIYMQYARQGSSSLRASRPPMITTKPGTSHVRISGLEVKQIESSNAESVARSMSNSQGLLSQTHEDDLEKVPEDAESAPAAKDHETNGADVVQSEEKC